MSTKYCVELRTTISKMLGTPGYLVHLDLLAVKKMIKNARRSMMPRHGERGM